MFNLDTLEYTAFGLCIAACVYNEVDAYKKEKAIEEKPVVTTEDIQKLYSCDDRRNVIVAAGMVLSALSVARTLKNRKK